MDLFTILLVRERNRKKDDEQFSWRMAKRMIHIIIMRGHLILLVPAFHFNQFDDQIKLSLSDIARQWIVLIPQEKMHSHRIQYSCIGWNVMQGIWIPIQSSGENLFNLKLIAHAPDFLEKKKIFYSPLLRWKFNKLHKIPFTFLQFILCCNSSISTAGNGVRWKLIVLIFLLAAIEDEAETNELCRIMFHDEIIFLIRHVYF